MSLVKSIATVGGCTILSRITGFMRDVAIANVLGAGAMADAFFVALRFPNLFRSLFAEGAFSVSFVPLFSGMIEAKEEEKAKNFAGEALAIMGLALFFFVTLMEIFMPLAMVVLAPGFGEVEGKLELATELSRITFPYLLFISVVSLQSGILNSIGCFAPPASAPIIFNLTGIAGLFALSSFLPTPAHAISYGVAVAGLMQFFWLRAHIKRKGIILSPAFKKIFKEGLMPEVKLLMKRMVPGIVGSGVYQINIMVDTILVSLVGDGAVSWLNYASHVMQVPLGVVGVAVGTALLPVLSRQLKNNDVEAALDSQNRALEFALLLTVPAAMALMTIANLTIATLFEHGAFKAVDTAETARAVTVFAAGLPAYVLTKVYAPGFYARGDTSTPVKISVVCLIVNVVLILLLMKPFGHVGIAAATTVSAWINSIMLKVILTKQGYSRLDGLRRKRISLIILSSLIMAGYLYGVQRLLFSYIGEPSSALKSYRTLSFVFVVFSGMAVYAAAVLTTGAQSFAELKSAMRKKRD